MEKYPNCHLALDTTDVELIKRRMKFSGLEIHEIEKFTLWNRIKVFFLNMIWRTGLDVIPQYGVWTECTMDEWKRYAKQWDLEIIDLEEH